MIRPCRFSLASASLVAPLIVCAEPSFRHPAHERVQYSDEAERPSSRRLSSNTTVALPQTFRNHSVQTEAIPVLAVEASRCGRVYESVDYHGDDLEMRYGIVSATACAGECWAEPACKSYTFAKAQDACYLKGAQPVQVRSNCCVSGLRPCGAPPTPPPRKVYNYSWSIPPVQPLRGIAYGALPCTSYGCGGRGRPAEDMVQVGYEEQWGSKGRDDLGIMARLGSNTVRLYHSLGLEKQRDHRRFLDYAENLGLSVMPGYHTEAANWNGECPKYDCFETWKAATLAGFEHGFQKEEKWHPAVSTLILLNEPDFFQTSWKCQPQGPWCRVKAAISALDGVLAAERQAGVGAGRARFTVTWSFALRESIDGKVRGPGTFGFQDMVAAIRDPQIAQYTPRSSHAELQEAFRTRWVHGLNTQAPWSYIRDVVDYSQFEPIPWFIGEYGANGQDEATIQADLKSMQEHASRGEAFLGAAFFQFQTTYWKGGAEMNFGLFGLGEQQIGQTGEVCETGCDTWPVHCLNTDLKWLPGTKAHRAQAMATAWGGSIDSGSLCSPPRHLEAMVGNESGTLQGELGLRSGAAHSIIDHPDGEVAETEQRSSRHAWALVGAAAVLVSAGSAALCCVVQKRKNQERHGGSSAAEQAV